MKHWRSLVLVVGLLAWSCLGRVPPMSDATGAIVAAGEPHLSVPEKDTDPAHVTLRMIREPTPAWIPKPAEEIAGASAASPAAMKRYAEKIPGTGVTFDMTPIPGGRFQMGSPKEEAGRAEDEGPVHEVLDRPLLDGGARGHLGGIQPMGAAAGQESGARRSGFRPTTRSWLSTPSRIPSEPYTDMAFGMGRPAVRPRA